MRDKKTEAEAWGPPLDDPTPPPDSALDALLAARTTLKPHYTVGNPPFEVHVEEGAPWVFWRSNLYVPAQFRAVVTEPGQPAAVLDVVVEDGRLVYDRVSFARFPGQPSIRSTDMRRRIDGLKRQAAAKIAAAVKRDADGRQWLVRNNETISEFLATYEGTVRERGRGIKVEDDTLREVATIYTTAPHAPVRQIELKFHVSRSTANRYVSEARERGFLPKRERRQ